MKSPTCIGTLATRLVVEGGEDWEGEEERLSIRRGDDVMLSGKREGDRRESRRQIFTHMRDLINVVRKSEQEFSELTGKR